MEKPAEWAADIASNAAAGFDNNFINVRNLNMQLKANAINQADIDQLPFSEVLSNDSNSDLIQASTLSRFIQPVVIPTSNIDESLNKSFEIPKEVSQAYPNLQFHSKIGDSIRYHCVAQSPNEPSSGIRTERLLRETLS